jgi:hypothetical protein
LDCGLFCVKRDNSQALPSTHQKSVLLVRSENLFIGKHVVAGCGRLKGVKLQHLVFFSPEKILVEQSASGLYAHLF